MWPPLLEVVSKQWKPERDGQALRGRKGILNLALRGVGEAGERATSFHRILKPKTQKDVENLALESSGSPTSMCLTVTWWARYNRVAGPLKSKAKVLIWFVPELGPGICISDNF